MEERKQELLKLIDNLDWEKFNDIRGLHRLSNYKIVLKCLDECQKQPPIEQQLRTLGFVECDLPSSVGLSFRCIYDILYLTYIESISDKCRDTFYSCRLERSNTDKILSFAKYLKQLKEEDEA